MLMGRQRHLMETRLRVAVVGGDRPRQEDLARRIRAGNRCQVVASVSADRAAVALVQEEQPDLVLVWLESPLVEAMDIVQRIAEVCPRTEVWLVGDSPTEAYSPLARRWGAAGYLHWQDVEARVRNVSTRHAVRNT
jgi:DNA-binding NarL/FixJ family response regulator